MKQHIASADFAKMQEIFLAAVERHRPEEWDAYLAQACTDDGELRRQVNLLLKAHREAGSVPGAASQVRDESETHEVAAERPGTVIGPYKLLEQIGEGGMGTVWLAEQEVPVKRVVAVKLIKAGMDSKQVLARFEAERQALALMDHPNIAKVLDVGATSRPYFVMDLVKGVPITKYCDEHRLTPRQRLELFVPVCQAIQHAHQKGIIHRDIKPSNVLVALYDDKPAPKVIDFGVAKATGQQVTEETLHTGFGVVVGTVEYMSPEQASLNQLDVDTRSDIYSLGVLLYELLTGTTPLERQCVEKSGMLEALRVIREEDAPTLSNRLATTAELPAIAAKRGLESRKLTKLVRGELNWIVMKALEKDRNRRYETANALAMDLRRYLADEAVQACPPSAWYRLRKFVHRNKGPALASAALAVSLLACVAAVVAMQAKADRDRATREAWTSASVAAEIREARERVDDAWGVTDYADRMQRATDAAVGALHRADDFAAGGSPTDATRAELASTRQAVDELARHTRLVVADDENRQLLADDSSRSDFSARVNLYRRHHEALRQFGLDPIDGQVDDVAQTIANSRIRDVLLGMLLGWQSAIVGMANIKRARPQLRPDIPADVVMHADRLELLIRAARQQCGGPYALWQDLIDRKDVPGLVAFASSLEVLSFRPSLVIALSSNLNREKETGASYALLRKAVDRYPHDAWLHFELAFCQPPNAPTEAKRFEVLRHLAAASALRPDSALFHAQIGQYYASNRFFDKAVEAYRKAIALKPESHWYYATLAGILRQLKDWEGMVAAWREAARLDPDYLGYQTALRNALAFVGRYAEAAELLASIRQNPAWVDKPQANVRYVAACDAIKSTNGLVANPPPPDERQIFRKQALVLLTAELDAMRPRANADRSVVYWTMQSMLTDSELAWVREPPGPPWPQNMVAAWNRIPQEERDAWNKLWADIRELRDRTAPPNAGK